MALASAAMSAATALAALPPPVQAADFGSPAWLAQAAQARSNPAPPPTGATAPYGGVGRVTTPEQARFYTQQSIRNLEEAARRIAAAQAAQTAAQQVGGGAAVPNGLVAGGLVVDTNPATAIWLNADAPEQTVADGRTTVTIEQTAQHAILAWESFNVGRDTTVHFDQTNGLRTDGTNNWIALNRIHDETPSQIFGRIEAEGSIYLLNNSGILFGRGSQVNTHSLLASSLTLFSRDTTTSNDKFLNEGLVGIAEGSLALLYPYADPDANGVIAVGDAPQMPGDIAVEAGATIETGELGYALLAAPNVTNAGKILAADGQAVLAAALALKIPKPAGTGVEATRLVPESVDVLRDSSGADRTPVMTVTNTGIVDAERGNVTLLGSRVVQQGVALVSTSLTRPGSITLTADDGTNEAPKIGTQVSLDALRTVRLEAGSITAVLPSLTGETTTSSALSSAQFEPGGISVGGDAVTLAGGSLVVAPGASFAAAATPNGVTTDTSAVWGRIYADTGSIVDVSGLADVALRLAATTVAIPRVGLNELADSPVQRDGLLFRRTDIVIDATASGTRADGTRWVGSPLLNAQGYVDGVERGVEQLLIDGGTIRLQGAQVIAAGGSSLRLDGGYLSYAGESAAETRLLGADGRIYAMSRADPMVSYAGIAGLHEVEHSQWNSTSVYVDPILSGQLAASTSGYIVGGNAGTLDIELSVVFRTDSNQTVIGVTTALLAGSISAQAFSGRSQIAAARLPHGGIFKVDGLVPYAQLSDEPVPGTFQLVLGDDVDLDDIVAGFNAQTPVDDTSAANRALISAPLLNRGGFSDVALVGGRIDVQPGEGLSLQPGGSIELTAYEGIGISANLSVPGGSIGAATLRPRYVATPADIVVDPGVTLSARGRWINDNDLAADARSGAAYVDGGSISLATHAVRTQPDPQTGIQLDTTGAIVLAPGSVLDVSGGGYVRPDGHLASRGGMPLGRGGDIALMTYIRTQDISIGGLLAGDGTTTASFGHLQPFESGVGRLQLDGALLGYGFSGGGELLLRSLAIQVGGDPLAAAAKEALYLQPDFFSTQGFASYRLSGAWDVAWQAIAPADGTPNLTHLNLIPNYETIVQAPTGADLYASDAEYPAGRYATVGALDPFYRSPTDLHLSAGDYLRAQRLSGWAPRNAAVQGTVLVGDGAAIVADAGASVVLNSINQLTVLGSIVAHGGTIVLSGDTGSRLSTDGFGYAPYPDYTDISRAYRWAYSSPSKSVWLGGSLDVSGVALLDPLARPVQTADGSYTIPRTGRVFDGGSITLSNDSGFVVVEAGALLEASGAGALGPAPTLDFVVPGLGNSSTRLESRQIASDAGSITVGAAGGLYLDGTLHAAGGSADRRGGSLRIADLRFEETHQVLILNEVSVDGRWGVHAIAPTLVLLSSGSQLPEGLKPGDYIGGAITDVFQRNENQRTVNLPGLLYFAVDRLDASGIDYLALGQDLSRDVINSGPAGGWNTIAFSGPLDLTLRGSFSATAANYIALPAGSLQVPASLSSFTPVGQGGIGAPRVSITAPYVSLGGVPGGAVNTTAVFNNGELTVNATQAMDLWGQFDLRNFASASFESAGDIRLYSPIPVTVPDTRDAAFLGELYSAGDLNFTAQRLYPASGNTFVLLANARGQKDGSGATVESSIAFSRPQTGPDAPAIPAPLSAGGTLLVDAAHIIQDGNLFAPSGTMVLGVANAMDTSTQATFFKLPLVSTVSVEVGAGSLTSVSPQGQVVPYGITIDASQWQYPANRDVSALPTDLFAPPTGLLTVNALDIILDAGARVDLTGGDGTRSNDLQAYEWIPGTGGTRDVLSQYNVSFATGAATDVPLFADARPVYAVIPGYTGLAAFDPALDTRDEGPLVGRSVYLSGLGELPEGTYTLLPARYATLPNAYRLVQDTAAQDSLAHGNTVLADGSYVIAGRFVDTFTGAQDARSTSFTVQSQNAWRQYSEYRLTSANAYFEDLARQARTAAPALPRDGSQLSLAASRGLTFGAQLLTAPGLGGVAAPVDIASRNIQIVGPGAEALSGYLQLPVSALNDLGAGSLLIGGTRARTGSGVTVTQVANNVVLSNDASSALSAPEIILVATPCNNSLCTSTSASSLRLDDNAVMQVGGTPLSASSAAPITIGREFVPGDSSASPPIPDLAAIDGAGALLRISSAGPATVNRFRVGTVANTLNVGANSVIVGDASLTFSATGSVLLDSSAVFSAISVDADVGYIEFVNTTGAGNGLRLGDEVVELFRGADSVMLRSASDIFFAAGTHALFNGTIGFSAGRLLGGGGDVRVEAERIVLSNERAPAGAAATSAAGSLTLDAGTIEFGSGSLRVDGFAGVDMTARDLALASGAGTSHGIVDFGAAPVMLTAPLFTARAGSSATLVTTGALTLKAADGATTPAFDEIGGTLNLLGGTLTVAMPLSAPAGNILLTATGPGGHLRIESGGSLFTGAAARRYFDVTKYAPAGMIGLTSNYGDIYVDPAALLDFSAPAGGDAGRLLVAAPNGSPNLFGPLRGEATAGYTGGSFSVDTGAAADLDTLAGVLAASGVNHEIAVRTRAGDLVLSAGQLAANSVSLDAEDGSVRIAGTIDASGAKGGTIELIGAGGVDVQGSLLANATDASQSGGRVFIATSGQGNGSLNPSYGYQTVTAADSGSITLGSGAVIDVGSASADDRGLDGVIALRAPLLSTGGVNVAAAGGATLSGARDLSLEAYAVWSTTDSGGQFNGDIDPFNSGNFYGSIAAGAFGTCTPVTCTGTLLQFVQGFDVANATGIGINGLRLRPGIELRNPSGTINGGNITVSSNWNLGAALLDCNPCIDTTPGQRGVVTQYAYRTTAGEAPVLTLRAANDVTLGRASPTVTAEGFQGSASITDGFVQLANPLGYQAPQPSDLAHANALYRTLIETFSNLGPSGLGLPVVPAPATFTSGDPDRIAQYYGQYVQYLELLLYGRRPAGTDTYSYRITNGDRHQDIQGRGPAVFLNNGSVLLPGTTYAQDPRGYSRYLADFDFAIQRTPGSIDPSQAMLESNSVPQAPNTMLAPVFTGAALADSVGNGVVDNGVSPQITSTNPFPLASASLFGGAGSACSGCTTASTSLRLIAGADFASADPLATRSLAEFPASGPGGNIRLQGHDFYQTGTRSVDNVPFGFLTPTVLRTGTGSIELAAARDFQILDQKVPAAVYTAGVAAPDLTARTDTYLAGPAANAEAEPRVLTSGAVHPVNAGDLTLLAQRDVIGVQLTGGKRTPSGQPVLDESKQHWWRWMQIGNPAERAIGNLDPHLTNAGYGDLQGLQAGMITRVTETSINFGAFGQGLLSAGGDVAVDAGRDIVNLEVSLPTTWYLDPAAPQGWISVAGGDLDVHAGRDIVSGSYFVSNGNARIVADGMIAPRAGTSPRIAPLQPLPHSLVSTVFALQDAVLEVSARQSVTIGGIYNPSYLPMPYVGRTQSSLGEGVTVADLWMRDASADSRPYSPDSAVNISAIGGDVRFGVSQNLDRYLVASETVTSYLGNVLPASLSLTAMAGDVSVERGNSGLYPSSRGNLEIVANDSIRFFGKGNGTSSVKQFQLVPFGMIDADPAMLPSPVFQVNGAVVAIPKPLTYGYQYIRSIYDPLLHSPRPLHTDPAAAPARIYAANGDITDGFATDGQLSSGTNTTGYDPLRGVLLSLDKPAQIRAGRDIVNLSFEGQHALASDITLLSAGSDIRDNLLSLVASASRLISFEYTPRRTLAGPGTLIVEAGRDIGPFVNQTLLGNIYSFRIRPGGIFDAVAPITGIATIGDSVNPYLPPDGADVMLLFGVGPGMATDAFLTAYADPASAGSIAGVRSYAPDLVEFVRRYQAGLVFADGVANHVQPLPDPLPVEQAWALLQMLAEGQRLRFASEVFFDVLRQTTDDYNNPRSDFYHQYARGYQAIDALFPYSSGYTRNSLFGGGSGAEKPIDTGNLDLRGTTVQTQRGGSITMFGPGGQALVGSASAPPTVRDRNGNVFAGPATQGVLTLERGDIDIFLDRSLLLAQSRMFTEQGGDIVVWSSNGDINAGRGARTVTEIPDPIFSCDNDHYCEENARGKVSGAGIATLQTIPGASPGNVYLVAPRGTVDAGEGGIRVSGNLVVAAFAVANADNIQVQGTAVGVPSSKVDVGALSAGSAAAAAAQQQAQAMARQQPPGRAETLISVEVLGFGADADGKLRRR